MAIAKFFLKRYLRKRLVGCSLKRVQPFSAKIASAAQALDRAAQDGTLDAAEVDEFVDILCA